MQEIFLPTLAAMRAEGCPFHGCLYFGLMITKDGPKVIEYNCRFGDPEAQAVLPLLESDLFTIMRATTNETLDQVEVKFADKASCCVILASGGYPVKYESGKVISGLDAAAETASVYHAGTKLTENGEIVTAGGRVLAVTAVAENLPEAIKASYAASDKIGFEKMHRRSDIGARALKAFEA